VGLLLLLPPLGSVPLALVENLVEELLAPMA
jgi:hypothetical protein